MYNQCDRKMLTKMVFILIYLIFGSQLRSSKNKEEGKNERKSNDGIKEELLKSMNNGEIIENEELNLRSDNVRSCEGIISGVKEFNNIIKCKKKGIVNLAYK